MSVQQPSSLAVAGVSTTNTTYTLQPSLSQTHLTSLPTTPNLTSVINGQQLLPQTAQQQQLLSELSLSTAVNTGIQQLAASQIGLTPLTSTLGTTAVTSTLNVPVTNGTISTTSGAPSGSTTALTVSGGSPTKTKRANVDPNRSPLYLDARLPPGWHRKVSQRKSGASAGRYEVFIIGPTGKRFRSRNEMRAFFDKTSNDSNIDPDDFDFSIFGSNNITSGRAPPKTPSGSAPTIPSAPPMVASKSKPHPITKKTLPAGTATASTDKVHLPDVIPTSSAGAATASSASVSSANVTGLAVLDSNLMQSPSTMATALGVNNANVINATLSSIVPTALQKSGTNAKGNLVSDIMKNLEKIGMASVDAAKAARAAADQVREGMDSPSGSATSSEILQRLTEPLPQKPLTLPPEPSTMNSISNQQRNGNIMQPSTNDQTHPSSGQHIPFTSQLSMETADADAQISQLLETLQKDPKQLVVEGEKIAEFINSLTANDDLDASSPIPSTPTDITNSNSLLQPETMTVSSQQTTTKQQQQQPVNSQGVPSSLHPTQGFSPAENSSNVINKPPELTMGTTGFQASFLNSLASSNNQQGPSKKTDSTELDSSNIISSITSPVPPQQSSMPSNGNSAGGMGMNQQLSKSDVISPTIPSTSIAAPPHLVSASPVTLGGGAPSQMRAMQNLPQNTRLVRGPNGQYSLQKVHTIELSQEMQAVSKRDYFTRHIV